MDYKIKDLIQQVAPREIELQETKETVQKMEAELVKLYIIIYLNLINILHFYNLNCFEHCEKLNVTFNHNKILGHILLWKNVVSKLLR